MSDLVDRVYADGAGEQIEAESIDERISGNKSPVKVMNRRNRAIGHHRGVPDIALTLTFPDNHDLSTKFADLLKNNTQFTDTTERESQGGSVKGRVFLDCEVYDFSLAGREGANAMITVEVGALDYFDN